MDNSINRDIHILLTPFLVSVGSTMSAVVVTKVLEARGDLYASGFIHDGLRMSSPFVARIPAGYLTSDNTCISTTGCAAVEVRTMPPVPSQGFINDIIDFNGDIYFCGQHNEQPIIGRWSDGLTIKYNGLVPIPGFGSFMNPEIMFLNMSEHAGELYVVYMSHHPGAGKGGVMRFDANLNRTLHNTFDQFSILNRMTNTPVAGFAQFSTIRVIDNQYYAIGGYFYAIPPLGTQPTIRDFTVLVDYTSPTLNNYGAMNTRGHKDVETIAPLQKSNSFVNTNYRVFTYNNTNNTFYMASTAELSNGIPGTQSQGISMNTINLLELTTQNLNLATPCDVLFPIELVVGAYEAERVEENLNETLNFEVRSFTNPVADAGCLVRYKEDYKHWCPEDIQDDLDETTCPYFEELQAFKPSTSTTPLASLTNIPLCNGECLTLKVNERLVLGNKRFEWYKDNNLIVGATTCELDICGFDGGTYEVRCFHEESIGECMASFTASIQPPYNDVIVASPSTDICQGVPVTLSVTNPDITDYDWMNFPFNLGTNSTVTTSAPGSYTVTLTYANGCQESAAIDLYQKDLTLSQFAVNSPGTMNDNIYSEVCNHNPNTVTDIKIKTYLTH